MTSIVLDASVGVALVWDEDISPAARRTVSDWAVDGTSFVVPASFWTEVVNALAMRHRQPGSIVIEALHKLDEVEVDTVQIDRPTLLAGLDLVERAGLTIYDAIYLALARSLGARLATLDRELIVAGGSDAIDMWQVGRLGPDGHRLAEQPAPYGRSERPVTWPTWPGAGSYLATLRRQAMAAE